MRSLLATGFLIVLVALPLTAAEPLYGVSVVHAASLWPLTKGSGVKVGIIDTGIDAAHPALQAAYRGGYDFVHGDSVPEEESSGHGTFVAGVVLQVAPEAEIYALKIYGKENSFETADLVRAIDWAIAHQLDVLNLSFAMTARLGDARRALDRAEAAGIVVVAAAGNNASAVDYPAAFDTTIAVGAIDGHLNAAAFSNHGPELDLAAPGVDIYSLAARGSGLSATITAGPVTISATAFSGTRTGDVSGTLIDCGVGRLDQIPLTLAGNVAMLRLDADFPLGDALGNVLRGGAAALVVVNGEPHFHYATVNPPGVLPPTASVGSDDAQRLTVGQTVRVVSTLGDYKFSNGTSHAAPHVAGVAALLRGLAPDARPAAIRNALYMSAQDAGAAGRDDDYGWGIVDASAAARLLAPEKLPPPRRRATLR
ncbi:MAG TPA: S8 family serine peptidase [Thermoanaerobaculia bacterium]|nr:S8 family serine peptidase [Thermoanaerobaculia bacterium]